MNSTSSADEAADKIIAIVARGTPYAVIRWQMAVVARCLHVMPNWLYDLLFASAPRTPRRVNNQSTVNQHR